MANGPVPWWEWREGKRPADWTKADEERSRFSNLSPEALERQQLPSAPRRERRSRVHVVFDERGEIAEYALLPSPPDAAEEEELERIGQAIMLSPRLGICKALLRGESVPIEKLDTEMVARLGRRQ